MFSNDHSIKPIYYYYFLVFDYSPFLEIQLNRYMFYYFFEYLFITYCSLEFLKYPPRSLFNTFLVDCWLVCIMFIGSKFIDPETCPWVGLKIGRGSWWGCCFLLQLFQSIHWLDSRQFLKVDIFGGLLAVSL